MADGENGESAVAPGQTPAVQPTQHSILIKREHVPPAVYANAVEARVSAHELLLFFGFAMPPTEPVAEGAPIDAEFVARIVLPLGLLDHMVRQLNEMQHVRDAMNAFLAAQMKASQVDE